MSEKLSKQIFADYLEDGSKPIGTKLPTLGELAKKYNSSITTVGKVTAMLAAEGWLRKRQGSGLYIAKQIDSGQKMSKIKQLRIGLICPHIGHGPMPSPTLEGVMRVAQQHNAALEVAQSNWQLKEERKQIQMMQDRGVNGIILQPTILRDKDNEYLATEFKDFAITVVDLYQPSMKRPYVIFDNLSAGRDMTRYLISRGHRNISFITFDDAYPFRSINDRVTGYLQALREYEIQTGTNNIMNFNVCSDIARSAMIRETVYQSRFIDTLKQALSLSPRPTAIITPSDWFALRAIRYLESLGITQNDIVVCGFCNLPDSHIEQWPTTSHDASRLGELAAEATFSHIESGDFDFSGILISCPLLLPEQNVALNRIKSVSPAVIPANNTQQIQYTNLPKNT